MNILANYFALASKMSNKYSFLHPSNHSSVRYAESENLEKTVLRSKTVLGYPNTFQMEVLTTKTDKKSPWQFKRTRIQNCIE